MDIFGVAVTAVVVVALIVRAQFQKHIVYEWNADLLYVNGAFERVLEPGRHTIFRAFRKVDIFSVRSAEQWLTTGLIDVISSDRLPYRLSLSALYKVTNPRDYYVRSGQVALQKALQGALVDIAATRSLEDLLAKRGEVDALLLQSASGLSADTEIVSAQIETAQLPPETRRLFIEVEKARLEGLAALERARGEQASLRSLANAARMLKDNPELMNLRLLQALGATKGSTLVLGQPALSTGAMRTDIPASE